MMGNNIKQNNGNCPLQGFTGILPQSARADSAPHKSESLCAEKTLMPLDAVRKSHSMEQMAAPME
jgi:hypothetical protein